MTHNSDNNEFPSTIMKKLFNSVSIICKVVYLITVHRIIIGLKLFRIPWLTKLKSEDQIRLPHFVPDLFS